MLFSNEYSPYIQLNLVPAGVVVIVEINGGAVRDVEKGCENDFSFCAEVDPVHGRIGLPADTLVEINIVVVVDVILLSQPKSLICIYLLPFVNCLLYFLFFNLLVLLFHLQIVVAQRSLFLGCLFLNLDLFFVIYVNRKVDKLRVFLDLLRNFLVVKELQRIFLQINTNDSPSA